MCSAALPSFARSLCCRPPDLRCNRPRDWPAEGYRPAHNALLSGPGFHLLQLRYGLTAGFFMSRFHFNKRLLRLASYLRRLMGQGNESCGWSPDCRPGKRCRIRLEPANAMSAIFPARSPHDLCFDDGPTQRFMFELTRT